MRDLHPARHIQHDNDGVYAHRDFWAILAYHYDELHPDRDLFISVRTFLIPHSFIFVLKGNCEAAREGETEVRALSEEEEQNPKRTEEEKVARENGLTRNRRTLAPYTEIPWPPPTPTTASVTTTTYPAFLKACDYDVGKISSACSCVVPSVTTVLDIAFVQVEDVYPYVSRFRVRREVGNEVDEKQTGTFFRR